jgi:hypothetical protein
MATEYKPGDDVKFSGIYKVVHESAHTPEHEVTCVKGNTFPPCSMCGDHVRFTQVHAAHYIENIEFFK